MSIHHQFNPITLCHDLAQQAGSGHLQVSGEEVQWQVFLIQGHLQYAAHSAQTLETIEYHALRLGFETAVQRLRQMDQATLNQVVQRYSQERLGWIAGVVSWLVENQALTPSDQGALLAALAEDALEAMLWLTRGSSHWQPDEAATLPAAALPSLGSLVAALEQRLQAWQKLRPLINSPHEQPYCLNPSLLQKPIPGGVLSPEILEMLVKLMQKASIRKLSLFLKQDDLRVAQLLHPYLKYRVLGLHPPAEPARRLPSIPTRRETEVSQRLPVLTQSTQTAIAPGSSGQTSSLHQAQRLHRIVCIDDSPAMLNTIQQYLGTENFEVVTVENPMESLTALFGMKPDLILMDVSMPGINGNRLCQILRRSEVFKQLPIIMVSGNTGTLDKAKAQSSGATDYLTKPFSREELLAIVKTHLTSAAAPSPS